ncbi:hypothetical protein HPB51_028158 [Rhipicephalus microplus]|uniref:DDE Tnp4 domain-containing protein n=1 Tax=Rhipicephalus microplus TaxID=6941 RepID=A0A9J6CYD4_RHIMP|nr:hypothetical protein HPB51_028158 [Rhipicephalus microplus]
MPWPTSLVSASRGARHDTLRIGLSAVHKRKKTRWPNDKEAARNKRAFRALGHCDGVEAGLPDNIDAIDGCHVCITRPTECEEDYYNRKRFHCIILQAVCDADMVFTDVFVGFPGKAHDAMVLEESFLFEKAASRFDSERISNIQSNKIVIFTVTSMYICKWISFGGRCVPSAPVTAATLPPRLKQLSAMDEQFNHVHSKKRVVNGIAFGLLKRRFQRLDEIDVNSIPQAVEIVMAAFVLHNLARTHADVFKTSDIANSDLGIFSSEPVDVDHKPTLAARLRDHLAQSVPL